MLRLIAKESPVCSHKMSNSIEEPKSDSIQSPQHSFLWNFRKLSSGIYLARFKDTLHELFCEITLEVKESFIPYENQEKDGHLDFILVAAFPSIDIQCLQQKVLWDEYLYGTLFIQFQLKILEQFILFCEDKNAMQLFITFNEANQDYLEIYRRFLISEEEILSNLGEQIEITIPTDVNIYDELIDFMEEIDHSFRQTLWREQRVNPTYRFYLKSEALI